jgi:hypothetical protein
MSHPKGETIWSQIGNKEKKKNQTVSRKSATEKGQETKQPFPPPVRVKRRTPD